MNDQQIATLPPAMREAALFCQYWNLASGIDEVLQVLGKEVTPENKLWASDQATKFRKHGVELRRLTRGDNSVGELDYAVLQVIATKAIAELGGMKDEAEAVCSTLADKLAEADLIVGELRKYKDRAVIYELSKMDATR